MISDRPRHTSVYQCDRFVQIFVKVSPCMERRNWHMREAWAMILSLELALP